MCNYAVFHRLVDAARESRIAAIKRASGQENKNTFHLITPKTDLFEFFTKYVRLFFLFKLNEDSLETTFLEIAFTHYRERIKKVKKKKQKFSSTSNSRSHSNSLGTVGWNFRYDYKLGFLSETIQDTEWTLTYGALIDEITDAQ
jgi:hypothetical protein